MDVVAPLLPFDSNASIQTQFDDADPLCVPVTSIVNVWVPEASVGVV